MSLAAATAACAGPRAESAPPSLLESEGGEERPVTLFRNCSAARGDGGRDGVTCSTFALAIEPSTQSSFEALLERYLEEKVYLRRGTDGAKDAVSTFQLHVGDAAFPGGSYRRTPEVANAAIEQGFLVVGESSTGSTLRITCEGKTLAPQIQNLDSDCKAAMMYVLSHGIPADLFEQ